MYRYVDTRHKTFISFYHKDEYYKTYLETHFSNMIINKSVEDGDYDPDNSDEYIKYLIRNEKITDASVVVVLVGPETKYRKHVDWEIYAGLDMKAGGISGLVGILLPGSIRLINGRYEYDLPARLDDNVNSGYAKLYTWDFAINNFQAIIDEAFNNRIALDYKACNRREQMKRNLN